MRAYSLGLLSLLSVCGACRATEPLPDVHGLFPIDVPAAVQLSASVSPDSTGTRAVWLTFTNTGSVADTIRLLRDGACTFAAQLRSLDGAGGHVVWDSRPIPELPCELVGYDLAISGHGSRTVLAVRLAAVSVYVPAPPAGSFRANALLNVRGRAAVVPAGHVELP